MALTSPGVEVKVIDESFYTPAAAGTVPMIFVATASNKTSSSGAGTAAGTLKANAGKPYLITSQRELGETFGDPKFYSDSNGNMIHGGELNEYGLQTAYSLLGVTNRAYVVRADLDLGKLQASATAPGGEPADGAHWFDTLNSLFGILEWNAAAITTTGGQSFSSQTPKVITKLTDLVGNIASGIPKASVGAIGDYAVVATTTTNKFYFKSKGNSGAGVAAGAWVEVGSTNWSASHPVVTGTASNPTLSNGNTVVINATTVTLAGTTVTALASDINTASIAGITAAAVDGALEIYSTGADVVIANGTGTILTDTGVSAATYEAPKLTIAPHTSVPQYKSGDSEPAPTGSLWIKTTTPNGGANYKVKKYATSTQLWSTITAPIYDTNHAALFALDKSGGGAGIALGDLYVNTNVEEVSPIIANSKIFQRAATGATKITSSAVTTQLSSQAYAFNMQESKANQQALDAMKTISVTATGASSDADVIAGAINAAGFQNITAIVDSSNKIQISHKLGGEIRIKDTDGGLALIGFAVYNFANGTGTANLYTAPTGDTASDWVASNWKELTYTASSTAPTSLTENGTLWYSSVVDEVDLMIHNGTTWVGYHNYSGAYANCDPAGPIVAAKEPTTQSDLTALVDGDIWISTASVEDYPGIYRWNGTTSKWVLLDKADQTTENGVLFADARFGATGGTTSNAPSSTIAELLTSDFLDPDAPDPALYPQGMILWNLRRSGFNVKKFVRNAIDVTALNTRQGDVSMAAYYPHRWVTDSGNAEDGSGTFGRHAQRKSVVQALQAMVNSNTDIRDEESRQFNLLACPGYPELIGEMITLNTDRRLTAFVVGDTPFRLTPDATSLNEWATNVRTALEDNDNGAVSFDEYLGMYYPAGFTSDNAGNNIVVPASHMALRTIVLNDQVAFPWFAPAGTRRGGVSNATSSGFITSEGEFKAVALNTGQRDTLYSNKINPITFMSGAGLVVFGQKTRAKNASALDRINVARLVVYLRGQLELLAKPYLFEPNDKITRDQIKAAADQLMLELVSLRALYDFVTVCDESNNTPARIDKNELYLDVAIEPVKAIEFIYIPLRLKNTGEIAALG
jgi:hypothetical protein